MPNLRSNWIGALYGDIVYDILGAPIISVKVLDKRGEGTAADIMDGIQWIYDDFTARKKVMGNKAKGIINMSLGAQVVHQVMEASMLETFLDLGTSLITTFRK